MRAERLILPAAAAALAAYGAYEYGRTQTQSVADAAAVDRSKPQTAIVAAGEMKSQKDLEELSKKIDILMAKQALAGGDGDKDTPTPIVVTATPKATETPTGPVIERNGVRVIGVPDRIDSSRVDVAKGVFKNTLGLGTEGFLAEPGGLLVGPDFGSKSSKNPWGENPAGWDAMYDSGGSINPFSPVTQEVFRYPGPAYQNLPEGGFIFASAGQMTAKVGNATFEFRPEEGKNYFFVVRGLYPDGKQDSDRNKTVEFSNFVPGHAEVEMYQSRFETNTAFISEEQFLQKVCTSHSGGTNCGAEGCSSLKVVFYDVNTQALTVIEQTQGRFEDPSSGWRSIYRNW